MPRHPTPTLFALLAVAGIGCGAPAVVFPPVHPHLAQSAWPQSHRSPYGQGSSPAAGPLGGDLQTELIDVGLPSVTLLFDEAGQTLWGSNPLEVFRVRVAEPREVVARVPAEGGLDDLFGGAYTLLDAEGRFITTSRATIRVYRGVGEDGIELDGSFTLADPAPEETMRGLGLSWDGTLIAVTSAGRLLALDRATLALRDELDLGAEVSNNIALDEDGGIYIVSADAMHRVQWTGSGLSEAEADGAWRADYETGGTDLPGGRLGAGSGSTPSLMDVGGDRLVVITDAQPLMHLVAFWRDAIPAGWVAPEGTDPRTAGIAPVRFGDPAADSSVSEQSVLVMGAGALVVNNDYGDLTGFTPIAEGTAPPGIEKFEWDPVTRTLGSVWAVPDISCPNGIPTASDTSQLMYCVGRRGDPWTIEAIDWRTGAPAFHVETGLGGDFNSVYSATEVGPDGAIWYSSLTGVVRVGE